MANVRSANTWYVDTASESLDKKNISLMGVVLTGDGGAAELELADNVSGASYPSKLYLTQANNTTFHYDFSDSPIVFPNGIRVVTANNTLATLILRIPGEV